MKTFIAAFFCIIFALLCIDHIVSVINYILDFNFIRLVSHALLAIGFGFLTALSFTYIEFGK